MLRKCYILFFLICSSASLLAQNIKISNGELNAVARKIYNNECGGKEKNLTCWNSGENFASLGIGHFIWYPKGEKKVFDESFPALLKFLKQSNIALPHWLDKVNTCPWKTKKDFYNNYNKTKMRSLRILLKKTINLQAEFMFIRLQKALPVMLNSIKSKKLKQHILTQFNRVSQSPMGMYVLIDYVNFKGEGVLASERYKGQGWGLLQVLANMQGEFTGDRAIEEFMRSAKAVLSRRVDNSPAERNEKRWLPGWFNRIDTYKN